MPITYLDEEEEQKAVDAFTPQSPVATGAVEGVLNNILGIPNAVTRTGNKLDNFINGQLQGVLGEGPAEFLLPSRDVNQGVIEGIPSGRQVLAGGDALGKLLAGNFNVGENFNQGVDVRNQLEADNPDRFQMGGHLGDAVSILMGRAPIVRSAGSSDILAPKYAKILNKALKPDLAGKLSRLLGRTSEAAVETSALALLKDSDPVAAAGWAAGTQAGGMAALKIAQTAGVADISEGKFIKGGGKLMGTALAIGGLLEFIESGIPDDQDSWVESVQSGFDKMIPLMLLGATASLTGAGRLSGEVPVFNAKMSSDLADAFTTIPRGALESALVHMVKNDDVKTLMTQFTQEPESFTPDQLSRIQKAIEEEKLDKVAPDLLSAPRITYIDE